MPGVFNISEAASLALHTMVFLASQPGRLVSTKEIAETLGVSGAHLSKVMQRLRREGLVNSMRGPGGGFELARPADAITLLEVYEAIEGPFDPSACLLNSSVCRRAACILGGLVHSVNRQALDYLSGTRLCDVGHTRKPVG